MQGFDDYFMGVLIKAVLTGFGIGAVIVFGIGIVVLWHYF